ncbi:MAG: SEC-C domain-containing protein [Deltaproteobacteria bacterium]|nr:SEC-C domain-containing protein [Deltaproteobacteria bacterium]MBW2663388.1 SEC-C domain-containing protein [Deltaproteobacteria bacterium]
MTSKIVKSEGVTPTERLLANLCDQSFLKLWSYPNPFKEDKDELCDLLAVFENNVFIFFDRENLAFSKEDNDPLINWKRWKKKAIDSQTRTAHGAERYIRSGRKIFLNKDLTIPFPFDIDHQKIVVHKIIVAHGAKEACENSSEDNVYGSLGVSYGTSDADFPFPFMIHIDKEKPVHVFDSHNLPIIFSELDTVYDFMSYLEAKVDAINAYDMVSYCGEEDLLAHYFLNFDEARNKHFIGTSEKNINAVMIGEGEWKDFIELEIYKRKKIADKISYHWDKLLQITSQNTLDGTIGGSSPLRGRSAIHEMAKEPRFHRRALSERMIQSIRNFPETQNRRMRNLSFMPSFYKDKGYVFLQLKVDGITNYDNEYRPKRQAMLEVACGAAKNKFSHLKTVIGIAIDAPKYAETNSEDFILMDCTDWPDSQKEHYERANEGLNFFKTGVVERKTVTEFPIPKKSQVSGRKKVGRNAPCPCGSGKKYKKCCIDLKER